jgi:hypothetical protein
MRAEREREISWSGFDAERAVLGSTEAPSATITVGQAIASFDPIGYQVEITREQCFGRLRILPT